MNAVYYRHESTGCCPVKDYFSQYTNPREKKILMEFNARIHFLLTNEGRVQNLTKTLKGYTFIQTGFRKTASVLIRILFFRYGDKLVLLQAFDKPADYKKGSKVERAVNREYDIAEKYKKDFITNPRSYEDY